MKQIAAVDNHSLWIPGQQGMHEVRLEGALPMTIADLLALAESWRIDQLWLHRSYGEQVEGIVMEAGEWDILPRMPARSGWYHAFRLGKYGDGVDLVFPEWPTGYESAAMWNKAGDGCELITQVHAYNTALHFQYRYTPGTTARALLKVLHGGGAGLGHYTALTIAAYPPPPAIMHPAPARDFDWIRALTDEEQSYTYLHAFDKNAMYLGACASLEVGLGEWRHYDEPPYLEALETSMPGYWHLPRSVYTRIPDLSTSIPTLFYPEGDITGDIWITTPVLRAALEAHYDLYCVEAYLWPRHSRVLAPWQARLRVARQELRDMPLARRVLKNTYASGIGGLDGRWLRDEAEPGMLYRPDWRHMIVGQAAANFWRNMVKASQNGIHIVAAATDCFYVVSSSPAQQTAEQTGLKFGPNIGEYKIALADVPLEAVRGALGEGPSMRQFAQHLGQWKRETRGQADAIPVQSADA